MIPVRQVQKVLSGGRITISEEMRKILDIEEGEYVILEVNGGKMPQMKVIPAFISPRKRKVE